MNLKDVEMQTYPRKFVIGDLITKAFYFSVHDDLLG